MKLGGLRSNICSYTVMAVLKRIVWNVSGNAKKIAVGMGAVIIRRLAYLVIEFFVRDV